MLETEKGFLHRHSYFVVICF